MTLHIVSQSPIQNSALQSCLEFMQSSDALILINDGVYALVSHKSALDALMKENRVFALVDDLESRGLETNVQHIIDYTEFVNLSCLHNPIQSWY